MKKTWNKLIIVSFIVLAVVACAAIVFLYPYYNEYKVFDGIEAGQWNEVQKSYEALDSEKQKAVQEMLPDYAKHICLEYQTGEKDYIYGFDIEKNEFNVFPVLDVFKTKSNARF